MPSPGVVSAQCRAWSAVTSASESPSVRAIAIASSLTATRRSTGSWPDHISSARWASRCAPQRAVARRQRRSASSSSPTPSAAHLEPRVQQEAAERGDIAERSACQQLAVAESAGCVDRLLEGRARLDAIAATAIGRPPAAAAARSDAGPIRRPPSRAARWPAGSAALPPRRRTAPPPDRPPGQGTRAPLPARRAAPPGTGGARSRTDADPGRRRVLAPEAGPPPGAAPSVVPAAGPRRASRARAHARTRSGSVPAAAPRSRPPRRPLRAPPAAASAIAGSSAATPAGRTRVRSRPRSAASPPPRP